MAETTTKVVQISVTEESGKTKTFNLDNPKQNLSLNEIRQTLSPAFNGRWWLGNDGTAITALKSANYSTAVKVPIEGSDAVIEVTPNEVEFYQPVDEQVSTSVQVTGSPLVGAYVTGFSGAPNENLIAQAMPANSYVSVTGYLARSYTDRSATLVIVTEARTVTVPIRIVGTT